MIFQYVLRRFILLIFFVMFDQVCHTAVGLVGDICRALGDGVRPYCDEIMTILLEDLSNNDVHRMVKPQGCNSIEKNFAQKST